jgi:hypothetical protein
MDAKSYLIVLLSISSGVFLGMALWEVYRREKAEAARDRAQMDCAEAEACEAAARAKAEALGSGAEENRRRIDDLVHDVTRPGPTAR